MFSAFRRLRINVPKAKAARAALLMVALSLLSMVGSQMYPSGNIAGEKSKFNENVPDKVL
jgi:hypothetical protein